MKSGMRIILLFLIFCIISVPVLAGCDVGYINVKPSGDLESGKTNVTAEFQIDFTSVAGETFPSDENLLLTTDLTNPLWTYSIYLDGIENSRPPSSKNELTLSGWELSYDDKEEYVKVKLNGLAPKVNESKQINLVTVAEASAAGRSKEIVRNVSAFVTNPNEVKGDITSAKDKVSKLQKDVAKYKVEGIDVSKAEGKINEALSALKSASGASYSNSKIYIKNAETLVQDGYSFLDMSITKQAIENAKEAIDKTDEWITYFQTEKKMESDPRLTPIITKREFAAEDASDASELYDAGKYSEAKVKAEDAYTKADEAFNSTQNLEAEINATPTQSGFTPPDLSGYLIYIIGFIVVLIIIIVLLIIIRRRGNNGGGKGGSGGGGGSFGSREKPRKKKSTKQYDELF